MIFSATVLIDKLTILYLILAFLSYSLAPSYVSLIFALVGLAYIPGFRVIALVLDAKEVNKIGLAPVVGLALLALQVLLAYGTSEVLRIDFKIYLILCTLFLNLICDAICYLNGNKDSVKVSHFISMHSRYYTNDHVKFSIMLFFVALASGILLLTLNYSSLTPDGALYSQLSAGIASNGVCSINLLNRNPKFPLDDLNGLTRNQMTWFLLGIFFAFGGSSFFDGNLYVALLGSLLIFPVYEISRTWFDSRQVSTLACLLLLFNPLIRFFSIVLCGADMSALIFGVSAVALLEQMRLKKWFSIKSAVVVSLLFGASMLSQETLFIILYLAPIAILYILEKKPRQSFAVGLLVVALFFAHSLSVDLREYFAPIIFLGLFVPVLLIFRKKNGFVGVLAFIISILTIFLQLRANRYYMFPGKTEQRIDLSILAGPLDIRRMYNVTLEMAKWLLSPYLVVLSVLSAFGTIVVFKQRLWSRSYPIIYILIDSAARIMFQTSGVLGTGLLSGRFLIADIVFLIVLGSFSIYFVLKLFERKKSIYTHLSSHNKHSFMRVFKVRIKTHSFTILLVLIFSINLLSSLIFVSEGLKQSSYIPTIINKEAKAWIENNTLREDRILVASTGYVIFWSYETSSRMFISLGEASNDIQLDNVSNVAKQFNASYVILDSTTPWLYPSLKPYYTNSFQIGEIIGSNTDLNLKVEFISQNTPLVIVFKTLLKH